MKTIKVYQTNEDGMYMYTTDAYALPLDVNAYNVPYGAVMTEPKPPFGYSAQWVSPHPRTHPDYDTVGRWEYIAANATIYQVDEKGYVQKVVKVLMSIIGEDMRGVPLGHVARAINIDIPAGYVPRWLSEFPQTDTRYSTRGNWKAEKQ